MVVEATQSVVLCNGSPDKSIQPVSHRMERGEPAKGLGGSAVYFAVFSFVKMTKTLMVVGGSVA